jgi:hypothetical protein
MGLFTKDKKKEFELPELSADTPPPRMPVTRQEVQNRTKHTVHDLTRLMDDYRHLLNGGDKLTLHELRDMMHYFTNLAREFEKIYELMRFDLEKYEAIDKYDRQTFEKRKALIKQLEEEEKKAQDDKDLKEPPKPPKKGS